jgi:hypothetical protein
MKLHILKQGQEPVKGYDAVFISNNTLSLEHVSNNECEFILAPDIMDSFNVQAIDQLVLGLLSKLRAGGTLVIGGTHIRLFAKAVINGLITHQQASQVISSLNAMTDPKDVTERLQAKKLTIETITMDGLHYEIKATRTKSNS